MATAEAVKVIVRCRPMNSREKDLRCKNVVFMDPPTLQCSLLNPEDEAAPPKSFTFDGVYDTNSNTEQIYNDIASPLVEGVLEGYNGTVFAYGQTGCGKSFTMQGIPNPPNQRGIIPRAFEHIFEAIAASEHRKFLVHASYLEIYNEEIRDLLGKDVKKKLDMKEHPEKGVHIPELSLHAVHNVPDCEALMDRGWKNRSVGATLMNADSSRSHSIFTINLEMIATGNSDDQRIRKGKLNLVDLAGSERQAKTGATGDRLKEATKINLSLSALGNVISALVDGKSKHIPYRDSKLTRLLQDSLGGNTKTLMVACLSPADNNYDETLSTLRYANRAKNIRNRPRINEDPKDAMLREYQEEIQKLKQLLQSQSGSIPANVVALPDENALEQEREKIRQEYEDKIRSMKAQFEVEKETNAKANVELENVKRAYDEEVRRINERLQEKQERAQAAAPAETLKKLKEIEGNMVGGERANDREFKEKRQRRKKAAEARNSMLAAALAKANDEDGVLLRVYDDIQDELRVKTESLRKYKQKVRSLEREVLDLQSEFESDRMDYLETIRRQDQQLRLLTQILEKIQPTIRKDCNYSNLESVRQDATWSDELQKWRLPELVLLKTKLPPAANGTTAAGAMVSSSVAQPRGRSGSNNDYRQSNFSQVEAVPIEAEGDKFLQKLERGEQEDLAGRYFNKPSRAAELLNKTQDDIFRAAAQTVNNRRFPGPAGAFSSSLVPAGHSVPLTSVNLSASTNSLNHTYPGTKSNSTLTFPTPSTSLTSWSAPNSLGGTSNNWTGNTGVVTRKPSRLEALPPPMPTDRKSQKKSKHEINMMDIT